MPDPIYGATLPPGCICPPTSEQTCMNPLCPRRHPLSGARTTYHTGDPVKRPADHDLAPDGQPWAGRGFCWVGSAKHYRSYADYIG
jgi:hypothetical protein